MLRALYTGLRLGIRTISCRHPWHLPEKGLNYEPDLFYLGKYWYCMNTRKPALLIVDMTNDFIYKEYNPNLALERARDMIPKIRRLQELFLQIGYPVIYASDRHLESDFELKKWGPHSMKGTAGSEIADGLLKEGLKVLERDWTTEDVRKATVSGSPIFEVEKGSYSSFVDNGGSPTAMASLLEAMEVLPGSQIYITGLHAACCDKHTAADAWIRGYEPVMVSDCVDSFDDPDSVKGMDKEQALRYEKYWYDAKIMTSEEVIHHMAEVRAEQ